MGITKLGQRISGRVEEKYLQPKRTNLLFNKILLDLKKIEFRAKDIVCGTHFNLILTQNGQLYSWGQNNWFQTGHINESKCSEIDVFAYKTVVDKPKKIMFPEKRKVISYKKE